MTCCESLHEGDYVYVHGAQDGNVKDLVRAAPDVEFARSEAFWYSRLQRSDHLSLNSMEGEGQRACKLIIPRKD